MNTYKVGDMVRVKSLTRILETLDYNGLCDDQSFPEGMYRYCDNTFKIVNIDDGEYRLGDVDYFFVGGWLESDTFKAKPPELPEDLFVL